MGVGIEWKVGILRIGKDFHQYGDRYDFSCLVTRVNGTAYLEGGSSGGPAAIVAARKELRELFQREGIKEVVWTRIKNGQKRIERKKVE